MQRSSNAHLLNACPPLVKSALQEDILKRPSDDKIRIAYDLADCLHINDRRKGFQELPYITHPVRVYDLVKRCTTEHTPDREVMLAAALLHDTIEDHSPKDDNEVRRKSTIRKEVAEQIRNAFSSDPKFAEKVVDLVEELTNPEEFLDENGKTITKEAWQVAHAKNSSLAARVVKVCDQTANMISDIEELPNLPSDKIIAYREKAKKVVAACYKNLPPEAEEHFSLNFAVRFFEVVCNICETYLGKTVKLTNGEAYHAARLRMEEIDQAIRHALEQGGRERKSDRGL